MSIALRSVAFGVLVTLFCQGTGNALEVENIVFESGSIGASGSPAASGWEYIPTNTNPDPNAFAAEAVIENVPNRTFQTGTNSEALVLHPWYFNNDGSFNHGAEWNAANDAGGTVQTVDPGEIVYIQMEVFSDVAGGGQWWKLASAVGFRGNGVDAVDRGFNDEGEIGNNGKNLLSSVEADWTFDSTLNFNGLVKNSDIAQKRDGTRYLSPPTTEELDKTYLSTAIFRQGVDAATPFVGTESEVSEVLDNQNGGESSATGGSAPFEPWGGNSNVITGLVIDRAQINILRGSNNAPGSDPSRVNQHSSFIDPDELDENSPNHITNAVLGIKMFRFGITDMTDVNLDGVTDALDQAIVTANLGAMADQDGLNGPTFFEGDIDNDLDVDDDDLAFFSIATTPGDYNNSGVVEQGDLDLVLLNWGDPSEPAPEGWVNDLPTPDIIDQDELDGVLLNWGNMSGNAAATGVPEPASALSLALGLAILRCRTRSRRRAV